MRRRCNAPVMGQPRPVGWCPDRSLSRNFETAHEGAAGVMRPWDFACEAVIPCLDTPDTLPLVIELLRLQTVRPYIVLIDTGSTVENFAKVEALRAEDVEVHCLRFGGMRHPSDFPAVAMDLAFSMCRTNFMFTTHADVFLRSRCVVEELLTLCGHNAPAVGYQMSPRQHADWERMVSHTCTMFHTPTMDSIGAGWSLRRLCNNRGFEHRKNVFGANWPDTELLVNYCLFEAGMEPLLIGTEANHRRVIDERIDHCRTLTAGRLYSPSYAAQCERWLSEAMREAEARVRDWSKCAVFTEQEGFACAA